MDQQGVVAQTTLSVSDLETIAEACRSFVFATNKHVGGSLSSADFLTCLYFSGLANLSVDVRNSPYRDKVVFSKGHACTSLFMCLWLHGYLSDISLDELVHFGELDNPLPRMPQRNTQWGMEMSTGALGQGLSFGNGLAIADRRLGRDAQTYVILGDAECGEGQVWEAANTSYFLQLKNVTAIVDANGFGSGIAVAPEQWAAKWSAFGWKVFQVDGHNIPELCKTLAETRGNGPCAIILRTVKGYGLDPAVAGTNGVGSEVDRKYIPPFDLHQAVAKAKEVVDRHRPNTSAASGTSAGRSAAAPVQRDILSKFPVTEVGATVQTKAFGQELLNLLDDIPNVFLISPDAIRNSGLKRILEIHGTWTWDNHSSPVIQHPIAEQDAASLIGGLTAGECKGVLFLMEGFVWRMLDSMRESLCFPQIPAVIVATSAGLSDPLGPMVQSDSCFAAVSTMFNIECFEACDVNEAKYLFSKALQSQKPAYLRLPHESITVMQSVDELVGRQDHGGCWVLSDTDTPALTLITAGSIIPNVLEAVTQLREIHQVAVRVLEIFSVTQFKQLSKEQRFALIPRNIPSMSVHNAPTIVLSPFLSEESVALGLESFGLPGAPVSELYKRCGLGVEAIVEAALALIAPTRPVQQ